MSKSRPTIVFSVRIDEILYQTGELLKGRHPHTLSQSKIYFAGLKSVITSLVEKGDQIPEDVIGALVNYRQDEVDALSQEIEDLRDLQKKHVPKAASTFANPAGLKAKPGYRMVMGEDENGRPVVMGEEADKE